MKMKCIIFCISLFVTGSLAGVAPFIKPCTQTDFECMTNSGNIALPYFGSGITELGIAPLEPLTIKKPIEVNNGDLHFIFKNVVVKGLGKCIIKKIERDQAASTASLTAECEIEVDGEYIADGKLVVLVIEGVGTFRIGPGKVELVANIKLKPITKDGKQYYKISSSDFKYLPLTKFDIKFENLFNGDKSKAEPVEKLLNESWKELITSPIIGEPVIKAMFKEVITEIIGKFFLSVPAEELEIV